MSHKNKHMTKSNTRQLVKKYSTLTALFALATVTTGMVGFSTLVQTANPYGPAVLSGSAMCFLGACLTNSQRSFYSKKLKRRHPSYNAGKIRQM